MANVTELYGRHPGADIYVIGTGTSMRVFPLDFLRDKITIGLNLAWQLLPVRYAISMVPHLNFPEFLAKERPPHTAWITKYDKYKGYATPEQISRAEAEYYFFRTDGKPSFTLLDEPSEGGRVLEWVREPTQNFLYLWTSISQSAVNLAANMGAKNIILVGCDNAALMDNHHANAQHTLWKGADPAVRYQQYYEGLAEIRAVLRRRGVNVVSLNPFLKLDAPDMDFKRLCVELNKDQYVPNQDIYQPSSLRQNNIHFLRLAVATLKMNVKYLIRAFRGVTNRPQVGAEPEVSKERPKPLP
jgi:hypothetical protein